MTAIAGEDVREAESLRELFSRFGARVVSAPLQDFSRLHQGALTFCEVEPATTEELSAVVRCAFDKGVPIRTRGNGHALNGSSLPVRGELIVRTTALISVSEPTGGVVSVGAGCVLWSLEAFLRSRGFALPVLNDGYPAPTVGGFVAAGGIGTGSTEAGGFWENVCELTLVNGQGRVRRLPRHDPLFCWIFGSMGQLGIVAEAKLDVFASPRAVKVPYRPDGDEEGRVFWFTLFVPETSLSGARARLDALERKYRDAFTFRDRYSYLIRHRNIVAPLVWPYATSCYAVGSWGIREDPSANDASRVYAFDADFMGLAASNGYRRYVQSEVPSGPRVYEECFGKTTYLHLQKWRGEEDPDALINRGWVFHNEEPVRGL